MPVTPTVNLSTGAVNGTILDGEPFDFTLTSAATATITITGRNEQGGASSWFSPNPATISSGSRSVAVSAAMISPPGTWFSYIVSGMNAAQNVHIVVGAATPTAEKKAS
jgi:hypothetical protein